MIANRVHSFWGYQHDSYGSEQGLAELQLCGQACLQKRAPEFPDLVILIELIDSDPAPSLKRLIPLRAT